MPSDFPVGIPPVSDMALPTGVILGSGETTQIHPHEGRICQWSTALSPLESSLLVVVGTHVYST